MPQLNQAGIDIIKQYEGFRPTPYQDANGNGTIGYGHRIRPNESFPDGISQADAITLMMRDCAAAGQNILSHISAPLTDNQYSALVSLVYNEGTSPLIGHLGHYLNDGDYQKAADEFPRWVFASGKELPGLIARRHAERDLFLTT